MKAITSHSKDSRWLWYYKEHYSSHIIILCSWIRSFYSPFRFHT